MLADSHNKNMLFVHDLVHWQVDILSNGLPEFPSASLSSIDVATATTHSSASQNENPFYAISPSINLSEH